jgi:hypothetical protein
MQRVANSNVTGFLGHTEAMDNENKPTDRDTLSHIRDLVAQEKLLRSQLQQGEISTSDEHERLRRVEVELDQCWDLLRQRRALRETDEAAKNRDARPPALEVWRPVLDKVAR